MSLAFQELSVPLQIKRLMSNPPSNGGSRVFFSTMVQYFVEIFNELKAKGSRRTAETSHEIIELAHRPGEEQLMRIPGEIPVDGAGDEGSDYKYAHDAHNRHPPQDDDRGIAKLIPNRATELKGVGNLCTKGEQEKS
ncbi:MAG: hypothetical protein ACE5OP_10775 [Candidatus Glassbacteria bacterium]